MHFTSSSQTCLLLLSSLFFASVSHSLPVPSPSNGLSTVHPRSPDPRMVPNDTDLLSNLFAKAGLEALDSLNHPQNNDTVDDSQSARKTLKAQDTTEKDAADGDWDGDVEEEDSDSQDPAKDTMGFMESLFEDLKKKFRETLDSSDELMLD